MKNLLFILLVFVGMATAFAQEKDLQIVATSGAAYQMNDIYLDWTLGETVVQFLDKPSMLVSAGFHQPSYSMTDVNPIPDASGLILVLPNPFSDVLEIKMSYPQIEIGQIELYDAKGRQCWKQSFEGMDIVEQYATPSLPAGQYYLVVSLLNEPMMYSYPIIKI